MEILKDEFDTYIELKNNEIENMVETKLKNRKMKENIKKSISEESCLIEQPDIEKIDFNTKKTYYKILETQNKKLKSSKAYKKLQALLV